MGHKVLFVLLSTLLIAVSVYSQIAIPIAGGAPLANPYYTPPSTQGIAATATAKDADGTIHTYYLWKVGNIATHNSTLPLPYCQSISPDVIRRTVPTTQVVALASITSDAERMVVRDMIRAQKAPFVFDGRESYWVDNVYDFGAQKWVALSGACNGGYYPWGDGCGLLQPEPGNPITEYCTTFDMRGTLLCSPGDKCYDVTPAAPKGVLNPTRKCFYDGVYNNIDCNPVPLANRFVTGCIFEARNLPLPAGTNTCAGSGSSVPCPNAATSAITNGGFEIGQFVAGVNQYNFPSRSVGVFGWQITAGAVSVQNSAVWKSATGDRSIALNAEGVAGVISQVVNIDRTKRAYTLNFNLAANPTQAAPANRPVQVSVYTSGGQTLATQTFNFDSTGKTPTNMGWIAQTLNFNSVDGEAFYTIEFKPAPPATGSLGPVIDSVSLCAGATVAPVSPCSSTTGNILTNSGFEAGNFVANSAIAGQYERLKTGATDITGWTVSQGPIDWVSNKFVYNDQNSAHSIHLVPGLPNPAISQAFTTPDANQRLYSLNFAMSGIKTAVSPAKSIRITVSAINNDKSQTVVLSKVLSYNTDLIPATASALTTNFWQQEKVQFSSVSGIRSYVMVITGTTDSTSTGGALVDDFQLCEGPELPGAASLCPVGPDSIVNGKFTVGTLNNVVTGKSFSVVQPGYGDYDILTPTSGQSNINGWTVTAGRVMYTNNAWAPLAGTTRSVGLLPGSSIASTFKVPTAAGTAYALTFATQSNVWNGNAQSSIKVIIRATSDTASKRWVAYSSFYPKANWDSFVVAFVSIDQETSYTVTVLEDSKTAFGTVISDFHVCATTSATVNAASDFCNGQPKYLTNHFFEINSGFNTNPFTELPVGDARITNWTIAAGTVDHMYNLWAPPVAGKFSIDLSGHSAATFQQVFTLPATAAPYVVKYAVAGNPDCAPVVKSYIVKILKASDKSVVKQESGQFSTVGMNDMKMGWVERDVTFSSVTGVTEYLIQFVSLDETACGTVIGNAFVCLLGPNAVSTVSMTCNSGTTNNFIRNGGFEVPTVINAVANNFEQTYANSPAIIDWSLEEGTVDQIYRTYWTPSEGQRSIDLNGISPGILTQMVNLGPTSAPYTLSWQMSSNPGAPTVPKRMNVTVTAASTGKVVTQKTYSWTQDKLQTSTNMEWTLNTLPFQSVQGESLYKVFFASIISGSAGIALDDIRLCGAAPVTPSPASTPSASRSLGASTTNTATASRSFVPGLSATSTPAPSSAPAPTDEVVMTITADNTFEVYVDGSELVPVDVAKISFDSGCKGKEKLGPSKYCCVGAVSHPRCNWPETETLKFNMKNSSIMAVHVVNFRNAPSTDTSANPPLTGGGNPAALMASWTRQGRICGVTDSEWRCVATLPAADLASGAWLNYNYDDSTWGGVTGLFGANRAQAWVPLGAGPAKLYGGNSIWYSANNGPEAGIADFAQWIWRTPAEVNDEMFCRYYIPNLYC